MRNCRVLVIEDEVLVGMDIVATLEAAGVGEVHYAMTEPEALEQIVGGGHWDAVVADANLNGRGIEQVAHALRNRHIPFLIVTGYDRLSLPPAIGDAPLLGKPFSKTLLLQSLREMCAPV